MSVGKNFKRESNLSSYKFTNSDLLRLLKILSEINKDANTETVKQLKQSDGTPFMDTDKLRTSIQGANGEYFVTFEAHTLNLVDLPKKISKISIDNFGYPHLLNNNSEQKIESFYLHNTFHLTLDFTTVDIFDFNSRPSEETLNQSQLIVEGATENWTKGAFSTIVDELSSYEVANKLLHKRNLYDIMLYFILYPILSIILLANDEKLKQWTDNRSAGVVALIFIFGLIWVSYCYRILFNWARWLFPIHELTFQSNKLRFAQKSVFIFLILSILSAIVGNIATSKHVKNSPNIEQQR